MTVTGTPVDGKGKEVEGSYGKLDHVLVGNGRSKKAALRPYRLPQKLLGVTWQNRFVMCGSSLADLLRIPHELAYHGNYEPWKQTERKESLQISQTIAHGGTF